MYKHSHIYISKRESIWISKRQKSKDCYHLASDLTCNKRSKAKIGEQKEEAENNPTAYGLITYNGSNYGKFLYWNYSLLNQWELYWQRNAWKCNTSISVFGKGKGL